MVNNSDVLVIGGGAAGIAAARELSNAGLNVTVIEARDRLGGRISTDHTQGFPVELGAEFIHGRSTDTHGPVERAHLEIAQVTGAMRSRKNGEWKQPGNVMGEMNHLFENMPASPPDQTFQQYIERSTYSSETKQLALRFVEGFHAADPERVSVHWLVRTTKAEEEIDGERSFRVRHGYDGLIHAIANDIKHDYCKICLNSPVREIRWHRGEVVAVTQEDEFPATRAIVTLPLGVFMAKSVRFIPELPAEKAQAMSGLETGPVIRVVLCFAERFWEKLPEMRNLSFLFTDDPQFPTWWTSHPLPYPILTGWAAARYARALAGLSRDQLVRAAVESLRRILHLNQAELNAQLRHGFVHDWQADPYACGAYSYVVKDGLGAPLALAEPLEDTLFFAGEATNKEGHNGTVHGAIGSGKRAAEEVIRASRIQRGRVHTS